MKKPAYLVPPCGRSRAAIITWLESFAGHHSNLQWNVKAYRVDLSFNNLVNRFRAMQNPDYFTPRWLDDAREKYSECENSLWEWGVESACRSFEDDDAYKTLWNGKPVRTEFSFAGRSGGWLILEAFNGHRLNHGTVDYSEWSYNDLRDLAEIVQFVCHTTRRPEIAIEEGAAFDLFANVCADIETDAEIDRENQARHDAACRDIATV